MSSQQYQPSRCPHQRVEDIKAAITYLMTLGDTIAPDHIGLLGICTSGGYTPYATQSDTRIKALATVSAACVGRMTHNGGLRENNTENAKAVGGALGIAGQWPNKNPTPPGSQPPPMFETDLSKVPDDNDPFFKDAAKYYGTKRGIHERSDHRVPLSSYDLMVSYASFHFQHLISPRPLLMVAGSTAQTRHYSEKAVTIAKDPKELFKVQGKNHLTSMTTWRRLGQNWWSFSGRPWLLRMDD